MMMPAVSRAKVHGMRYEVVCKTHCAIRTELIRFLRWVVSCNRLNSIPTKISTGVTTRKLLLTAWRYAVEITE